MSACGTEIASIIAPLGWRSPIEWVSLLHLRLCLRTASAAAAAAVHTHTGPSTWAMLLTTLFFLSVFHSELSLDDLVISVSASPNGAWATMHA